MEALPKNILLATDGSEDAALAARAAVDLSKRAGAALHVVHAWQPAMPSMGYSAGMSVDPMKVYEHDAQGVLDHQVEVIRADGGEVAGSETVMAPPVDAVVDLCERLRPDMVVMGSRGMGPVRRVLIGSVSEGVVHHASCPVLVVRGGDGAWPPSRILVGDDGSEDALRAANLAVDLGKLLGVGGVLVRAHEDPPAPIGGWTAEDRLKLDEARMRERESLEARADGLAGVWGTRPETRMVDSDAVLALLEVAEEGDEEKTLFVVGSRGLGAISRLRLGSVSTKILRAAGGSVLVCPRLRA